ncbi:35775_t:CDS:1, partial [Gigaspora margarita]
TLKQRTIEELRNQFDELCRSSSQVKNNTSSLREEAVIKKKSAMKSFFSSVRQQHNENEELTEFDKYLILSEIELTKENDPLTW